MSKETPPSVKQKAFDCPYCAAYTTQFWSKVWAKNVDSEGGLPFFPDENFRNDLLNLDDHPNNEKFLEYFRRFDAKALFIEEHGSAEYVYNEVVNALITKCFGAPEHGEGRCVTIYSDETNGTQDRIGLPALCDCQQEGTARGGRKAAGSQRDGYKNGYNQSKPQLTRESSILVKP